MAEFCSRENAAEHFPAVSRAVVFLRGGRPSPTGGWLLEDLEAELRLAGLVGIADPPRAEVGDAVGDVSRSQASPP
jgi:magnesium-transporting ATPase (P-type)